MLTPAHLSNLESNLSQVIILLEIPKTISKMRARLNIHKRSRWEVLNKSAIVLLVACWESFIKDLASPAFDIMLNNASDPSVFPNKVLTLASRELRDGNDERRVWELAGSGWLDVLNQHRKKIINQYVGKFNTPKPEMIDELFMSLLGIKSISKNWTSQNISAETMSLKLNE